MLNRKPPGGALPGAMPTSKDHNVEDNMKASMGGASKSDLNRGYSKTEPEYPEGIGVYDYMPFSRPY